MLSRDPRITLLFFTAYVVFVITLLVALLLVLAGEYQAGTPLLGMVFAAAAAFLFSGAGPA